MLPPDYKEHIRRIIDSKEFGRSKTYARLLEYIVERSVRGDIPKETTIAMEVFGKGPEFNSSGDTLVRVYMHNLRKKLDRYYSLGGRKELERLVILKGKYQAIFYPKSDWDEGQLHSSEPISKLSKSLPLLTGLLLFISLLSIGINFWQARMKGELSPSNQLLNRSAIWNSFLRTGGSVDMVLGDIFVYEEYDSILDRSRTIRDASINSFEELEALQKEAPALEKRGVHISPNPLLMKAHANALADILPLLSVSGDGFSLRLISRMVPENLQEGPLVYVGMYKSLGILSYVFESSHFRILPDYEGLLHVADSAYLRGSGEHTAHHTDIAYFSQRKGPNGNPIWIIAALTDTGLLQITQLLTEPKDLETFEMQLGEKLNGFSEEWELVCLVKGFDRTHLEMEVAYAYPLP